MLEHQGKARIIVAEGDPDKADGIESCLSKFGYCVCGKAASTDESIHLAAVTKPDLVMMDFMLPGELDWIKTADILEKNWNVTVVFLITPDESWRLLQAELNYPFGFLLMPFQDHALKVTIEIALKKSKDARERKKAKKILFEETIWRRKLIQGSRDGIVVLDQTGKVYETNQKFADLLGYSVEEIYSLSVWDWDDQWTKEHLLGMIEESDEAGAHFETRHRRKDGSQVDVEISTNGAVFSGGKLILCVCRDITDRKKAEEKLRESENRFRSLFFSTNDGVCLHEMVYRSGQPVDYRILDANPKFEEITGIGRQEAMGVLGSELYANRVPPFLEIYAEVAKSGQPVSFESYYEPMKKYFSISVYSPERGKFATVFQDITNKKRNEEHLQRSEALLNATQKLSKVGGWEWDNVNQKMFWTREVYRIHEIDPELLETESEKHISANIECYQPKDRPLVLSAFNKCIQEGIPFDLELPFKTSKGREIWIRTTAYPIYEQGHIVKVIGNLMDISDRKKSEQDLRESKERFELAMRFANDGLFDWNLETNQIYYSPGWKRILGYEDDEIKNELSEWERLTAPDDVKSSWEMINELLAGKLKWFYNELKMMHKDGHWVDVLSRANAVYNEQGRGIRVVGTHVDITTRKKAEELLQNALKEKEVLLQEIHHRVRNNMQVIISLLNMQLNTIEDESLRHAIAVSQNRIYAMSAVHEILHKSENLSYVNLGNYLKILTETTVQSYQTHDGDLKIESHFQPIQVRLEKAYPIGLVFNELFSNALKHAFTSGSEGHISLMAQQIDNEIKLVFADNGSGFPPGFNFDTSDSLGLRLVKSLVEIQLKGSLHLETAQGTKWEIAFPA